MEPITRLEKYLDRIAYNTSGAAVGNPLILYADKAEEYDTNPTYGDKALKAIQEGRNILVRVPNADGGKHTAIYSPVLTYQLPNYENDYLYLFYLRDEKQDLSALLGVDDGTVQMPTYGELQMKLSETYNGSPLGQPYINNSPAVGSSVGAKPVFFISAADSDGNASSMAYYDNPDRLATTEEVVDAYMAGNGYIIDTKSQPQKIVSVFRTSGDVISAIYWAGGTWVGLTPYDSSVDNYRAAMAKYLP